MRLTLSARWHLSPQLLIWLCLLIGGSLHAAPTEDGSARKQDVERRLGEVRKELAVLAKRQEQVQGAMGAEATALREAERQVSQARRELRQRQAELADQQAELQRVQAERDQRRIALEGERRALESLVRAFYALGRYEQIKLLLAQDNLDDLNRRLAYQRYLQRDRLATVQRLIDALSELAIAVEQLAEQAGKAEQALAAQQAAVAGLQRRQDERARVLATLDQRYRDTQARMRSLGRDEAALVALMETLSDALADIPDEALSQRMLAGQRGQLLRPLQGRLRAAFAGKLPDGRPSSGWWIAADTGAEVKAVAHGRVVFADWMRGYGLMLIIDHGDGFMSVYAGGEALLAEPGDWVEAGVAVATAGQSGGFAESGVYFELRRQGKPLDPASWVKR